MFFIKSCLQICLYSNVYEAISLFSNKWEQNYSVPDTYCINNDHANIIKFMKVISNLTRCKKRRNLVSQTGSCFETFCKIQKKYFVVKSYYLDSRRPRCGTLLNTTLYFKYFTANFAIFFRTILLQSTCRWLILSICGSFIKSI